MDLEAMAVTVIHFNCLHSHVKSPKFFWGVVKVKGPLGPYGRMISNDQVDQRVPIVEAMKMMLQIVYIII